MLHRNVLPIALTLGLCASTASAQTIRPLIHTGEAIPGTGAMVEAFELAINDSGTWIAHVDTNFPTLTEDAALLRNGLLHVREGTVLAQPPNTVLGEFEEISLNGTGDIGLVLSVLFNGAVQKSGVFWNLVPVVVMGDPFDQPGIAPNSVWNNLSHAKLNSSRDMLVFGSLVTPPSIGRKPTLARYRLDENGAVTATEVLASRDLPMAALGGDLLSIMPTNSGATCQNERGDFLCVVDGVMTAPAILLNMETVLAQTGFPSPVKGLNWKYLDRIPHTSINDFGDYVFTGSTEHPTSPSPEDSSFTIVKNGEVFAKEGDVIGSFSTEPMGRGSFNPVLITNSGDVFWYWENAASTEFALMRDYEPILQTNVTHVGANLVQSIPEREDAFHVSPDGRFWIGRVDVENVGETVLFVDFGLVVPIPGCQANPGRLSRTDGLALAGDHLTLAMDNGQETGVRPVVFFSTAPSIADSPCGTVTPFGELLISLQSRFARVILPTWDGANASAVDLPIPNDVALVNAELFVQGLFVDVNSTPAEDFRATNALRIQIGAP